MSRDYKFRAWHGGHKYTEPLMLYDEKPGDCLVFKNQGQNISAIMQYTGLQDRNGKEVYEGDLWISRPNGKPYEIKWYETGWYLFREKARMYENADGIAFGEVIGNIYEHQHLLTKEEPNERL